jgi:ribulose-phosphate 3-epimerase
MIEEPEQYLLQFVDAGASSITVHVETCPHLHQTLGSIHDLGVTAGVALNPSTPISAISEVLDRIDLVLVMTVNPGFGGQKLIKSTLNKVRQARVLIDSQTRGDIRLEVDGGIDSTNILEAANAGADVFVTGTSIFKHPSGPSVGTQALRTLLEPELLEQS